MSSTAAGTDAVLTKFPLIRTYKSSIWLKFTYI